MKTIGILEPYEQVLGFGLFDPGVAGSDLGIVSVLVWTPPKV